MQFAAFSCYFVPLTSKYSAQCPVLRHSDTLTGMQEIKRTKELPQNTDICLSITAVKTRRCSGNTELTLVPVP